MKQRIGGAMILGAAIAAAVAATPGCINESENCVRARTCNAGGTGTGGGTPSGCVPRAGGGAVGDGCGVFVSASGGEDGNAGGKASPVRTVAEAVARAVELGKPRVYACAETFEGSVEVPAGVTIYGGLACAQGWAHGGVMKKTVLTAAVGEIPLAMRGGQGVVRVEDVHVFPQPGNPGSGHGPGKPHVENSQLPPAWSALPPGVQPETPIGT